MEKKEGLYIAKYYFCEGPYVQKTRIKVGLKIGYTQNLESRISFLKKSGLKLIVFLPCKNAKQIEYEIKTSETESWLAQEHFRYTKSEHLHDSFEFREVYNLLNKFIQYNIEENGSK